MDDIDYGRVLRALEAQSIQHTEERRMQHMRGKIEAKEISAQEWEAFAEHIRLLEQDE